MARFKVIRHNVLLFTRCRSVAGYLAQKCGLIFIFNHYSYNAGNFTRTKIRLNSNFLDRLEEGVFKEMLEQMVLVQPPVGFVNVYNMSRF